MQQGSPASVMAADIVDYQALASRDEQEASRIRQAAADMQKPVIGQFGGALLNETGGGTIASFSSADDAVRCAAEIQSVMKETSDFAVRIGIHFGGEEISVDMAAAASGIGVFANAGGICISSAVYEQVKDQQGFDVQPMGMQSLKGLDTEMEIYRITVGASQPVDIDDVPAEPAAQPEREPDSLAVGEITDDALQEFRYKLLNGEVEQAAQLMEKSGIDAKSFGSHVEEVFDTHRQSGSYMLALEIAERFGISDDATKPVYFEAWNQLNKEKRFEEAAQFARDKSLAQNEIERSAVMAYEQYVREGKVDDAMRIFDEFKLHKDNLLNVTIAEFNRAYDSGDFYTAAVIGDKFSLSKARTLSAAMKAGEAAVKKNDMDSAVKIIVRFDLLTNEVFEAAQPKDAKSFLLTLLQDFIEPAFSKGNFKMVQNFVGETHMLDAGFSHELLSGFLHRFFREAVAAHNRLLMNDEIKNAEYVAESFHLMKAPMPDQLHNSLIDACEKYHLSCLKEGDLYGAVNFKNSYRLLDQNLSKESVESITRQAALFIAEAAKKGDFNAARQAVKEYDVPADLAGDAVAAAVMHLLDKQRFDDAYAVNKEFKATKSHKKLQVKIKNKYRELMDEAEFLTAADFAVQFGLPQQFKDESSFKAWESEFLMRHFDAAWDIRERFKVPKNPMQQTAEYLYWKLMGSDDYKTAVYVRKAYKVHLSLMQWLREFFRAFFSK